MIKLLNDGEPTKRRWTGRDDNAAHHHGIIPLAEPIVTLTLNWKRNDGARPELVGRFQLDMEKLVSGGYSRKVPGGYFLRFQRTGSRIEVAVNRSERALSLAATLHSYSE